MIKLYDYWRSSAAYRVRIALKLKNVPYEATSISLAPGVEAQLQPEYRAINAQMRVPAIETEQGVLGQSMAILYWLDREHPEPPLIPTDDVWLSAQMRAFALTIACDIHPLDNTSSLRRLKEQFGADDAAIASWYLHWIETGFAALEAQAQERPETKYAFGDQPSIADVCLVPQCANARRFNMDFAPFPRLAAIDEHCRKHPAFIAAAPENQKDAVKPT